MSTTTVATRTGSGVKLEILHSPNAELQEPSLVKATKSPARKKKTSAIPQTQRISATTRVYSILFTDLRGNALSWLRVNLRERQFACRPARPH